MLRRVTDSLGMLSNTYNRANWLTMATGVAPSSTVTYTYYPAGQVSNIVSVVGTQTVELDGADRLSELTTPQDAFAYTYNTNNGMVATMEATNSGVRVAYTYDILDRLVSITWRDSSDSVLRSFEYGRDVLGMVTNVTRETGAECRYGYDGFSRLTGETRLSGSGKDLYDAAYTYDAVGNRLTKVVDGMSVNYVTNYNRLVSWSVSAPTGLVGRVPVHGYASETIGTNSALGQLYVSNTVARTPEVLGTNFWHDSLVVGAGTQQVIAAISDAAGNTGYATNQSVIVVVTNATYGFNAAGCITNISYAGTGGYSHEQALSWNSKYQLTSVSTSGVPCESYAYDAAGQRAYYASGTITNWLVYDGAQVVAEVDATGTLLKSYTWGPGIDNLLAYTIHDAGTNVYNAPASTYYALTDHLGTVHALADESGTIVESYSYDAWGRVLGVHDANGTPLSESAVGNNYLWQGRWYSWHTGLYYFRARWYDPVTGRWLSKDPIGIGGGLNQYAAFGNNPVNFRDPDGLLAKEGHEYWMGVAVAGQDRGGIGGNLQTAGASIMTAFIDFWGARSIQNNAEKSGHYSGEGCTGKAVGHGLLAGGQIALAATAAFGGNNAAHPWYRYVGPQSLPTYASGRVASGAWVVRGRAFSGAPFGRNFGVAKNALQMPYMPNDVIRVQGAWKQFIRYRGRATGYPNLGTGGAHQWQVF